MTYLQMTERACIMYNNMKDIRKALNDEFEMTEELKSLVEAWAIARNSILTLDDNPFDSNKEAERTSDIFFDRLVNEIDQFAEKACDNLRYNDGVTLDERQELTVYSDVRVIAMHSMQEYIDKELEDVAYTSAFKYLFIDFLAKTNIEEALRRADVQNELHRRQKLNNNEELDFSDIQQDLEALDEVSFNAGNFMQDMTSEFVGDF